MVLVLLVEFVLMGLFVLCFSGVGGVGVSWALGVVVLVVLV